MSKAPAIDESATWPACSACPYKHHPNSACPQGGRWLVAELCPNCDPEAGRFCREHWRLGVGE